MLIGLVRQDYLPCALLVHARGIKTWRAFGTPSHFLCFFQTFAPIFISPLYKLVGKEQGCMQPLDEVALL